MNTRTWLSDAEYHWDGNRGYEAGILICPHVPCLLQPRWAFGILRLVIQKAGVSTPLFDELEEVALTPSKWGNAHRLFSEVRKVKLKHDKMIGQTGAVDEFSSVLAIAEQTAKVIYNATSPLDKFDEDSGAWIIAMFRGFVSYYDDDRFSEEAWEAVCDGVDLS